MRMNLIQPFIDAADSVLAETLQCHTALSALSMDEEAYRRQGLAAFIHAHGDIEGRMVLDFDSSVALKAAAALAGREVPESEDLVRETVCELANMIAGNAVTLLNDQGCHFKVQPPELHTREKGLVSAQDTEALVMRMETPHGSVHLNIAMHYKSRRRSDRPAAPVSS